jgi:hypothetical protein
VGNSTLRVCLTGIALTACDPQPHTDSCAVRGVAAPLVSAVGRAEYLMLSEAQEMAIVQLDVGPSGSQPTSCSGVLIDPRWVMSSAHCSSGSDRDMAKVRFGVQARAPALELESSKLSVHPDLDLMLIELPISSDMLPIEVRPLPASTARPDPSLRGDRVQLAGYGTDEHGALAEREFLVELVTDVGERFITVDGATRSGACAGDSGGPLLVRDEQGHARVAGLLSAGSAGCNGHDLYTRVDLVSDWLTGMLSAAANLDPEPCGGLTLRGRCFGDTAVWCSEGTLLANRCGAPLACGFAEALGFRCVQPDADACQGVYELGSCDGQHVLTCQGGALEMHECGSCSPECIVQPGSGRAGCVAPAN